MPLYEKLKFPAIAMEITNKMNKIVTFELIPTDWITESLWEYFPEEEPFSLNFESVGLESRLFLQNAGLTFYIVQMNILYGLLHFILYPLRNTCGC